MTELPIPSPPSNGPSISFHQQFEVPVAEVSVHWTEMAGSKIRFTSILHMAFELVTIKVCMGPASQPLIREFFNFRPY